MLEYSKINKFWVIMEEEVKRKPNRNALRSKALIKKAFLDLIETHSFSSLTVTDIVKQADINRATFYAHYSCIRDIAMEIENEIIEKMRAILSSFNFHDFFSNPTNILLQISKYIDEEKDYFRRLIKVPEANQFIEKLQEIFVSYMKNDNSIPEEIKQTKAFHLRVIYFAGGISNLYLEWLQGKLDCTLYDIPLEVSRILSESLEANQTGKSLIV